MYPKKDCVQETGSAYKDNHLKTQICEGMELWVPIWHSKRLELPRRPKRPKRLLRQTIKLPQRCEPKLRLNSAQPKKLLQKPKTGLNWLPTTCSSCMQIFCLSMPNTRGTKLYTNRPHLTPIQTSKAVLKKDPVPPSHCVPKQCGWSGAVLYYERAEEAPTRKHSSVCAACRTAQLLHLATAMLVLQPKHEGRHDSHECGFSRGWSSQSRSLGVPTYVAGSIQPSWERIESHGHEFASSTPWGYWEHMYPRKIQCTIHRKSFYEKRERKQEIQYWVYLQNSIKSSNREALRPVQETWGRIYHAQHTRLS